MGKVGGALALYQRPSCPGVPLMAAVGLVYGSTVFKNNFNTLFFVAPPPPPPLCTFHMLFILAEITPRLSYANFIIIAFAFAIRFWYSRIPARHFVM